MAYTQTERDREIVAFALSYLSANVDDFLGDWPEFFVDTVIGDYPLLKGQPPTGSEVVKLYERMTEGGPA